MGRIPRVLKTRRAINHHFCSLLADFQREMPFRISTKVMIKMIGTKNPVKGQPGPNTPPLP